MYMIEIRINMVGITLPLKIRKRLYRETHYKIPFPSAVCMLEQHEPWILRAVLEFPKNVFCPQRVPFQKRPVNRDACTWANMSKLWPFYKLLQAGKNPEVYSSSSAWAALVVSACIMNIWSVSTSSVQYVSWVCNTWVLEGTSCQRCQEESLCST